MNSKEMKAPVAGTVVLKKLGRFFFVVFLLGHHTTEQD